MKLGVCAYPLSKSKESGRGLERVIDEFCRYLDKENISYVFYDNDDIGTLKGSSSLKTELKALLGGVGYLTKLKKTANNVYLGTYPVASVFPLKAKKRPVVTAVHDLIPFYVSGYDNGIKLAVKRYCIKYSCKKSNRLIVPFQSTKEQITELFGVSSNKIVVIPYGVNHSFYYCDTNIRKEKVVSFLGEAKRAKGMDSVILAFKEVVTEIPDAKLQLASKGNELDEMKKLAADNLPKDSYRFVGFIPEDEMRNFYSSSKLFVFPSRYGFGLSALESMACGTPAIVGNTLDARDFIKDQELLVNPDDIKELSGKIIALLKSEEKYNTKVKEAVSLSKEFSWEKMSKEYLEVIKSVINE